MLSVSILAEVQDRALAHRGQRGFRLGGGNRQGRSGARHFQIDAGAGQQFAERIGPSGGKGDRASVDRRHRGSQNIRNSARYADFQPSRPVHGHRSGPQGHVRLHGNGSFLDVDRAGIIVIGAVEGHFSFTQLGHGAVSGKLASVVGQLQVLPCPVVEINGLGIHVPRQGRHSRVRSVKQIGRRVVHGADRIAVPDHHAVRHADGNGHRLVTGIHVEGSLVQAGQRTGQGHRPRICEVACRQVVPGNQRISPRGDIPVNVQADACIRAQRQVAHRQRRSVRAQGASVNRQ